MSVDRIPETDDDWYVVCEDCDKLDGPHEDHYDAIKASVFHQRDDGHETDIKLGKEVEADG